ncbi:hypothetical protein ARAM_002238 [Aspergillus rambellii]|uniref:SPIN90/Ldb17 leucine-rich domain-containing protein n=1 Tax=Aspergillus rambellii TaxID=308745 RepID=A0A0F8VVH9_9EURO|nr:hypothetical protein ARAM_002238 [Aspergillus rambellii]
MEFEVSVENEQQFWANIQEIVSTPCSSEDLIDNALRAYLRFATNYKEQYLQSELEVTRCSFKLISSTIFVAHTDYVRRQMIYGLLQEDDFVTLQLIASCLLFDGRQHEVLFHMMNEEGVFPRLLELLHIQTREGDDNTAGLRRLLMDLLYEMSRVQKVKIEDLVLVDDDFIRGLFDIIEDLSFDANDPYHYPVIRVLLVLNEQFMISAHTPEDGQSPANSLTNKVIKILSMHGNLYKTFGENIILLINREAETSLQLLTLKLLYLIFTTPSTYEYFFTNDLHVLVDILIRNLLDLPEEASALRHTYLRVLYPLLAHTQLKSPPHYKRAELRRMLTLLVRGQLSGNGEADGEKIMHFDEVDETTRRLVLRCASVDWLRDEPQEPCKLLRVPQKEDSGFASLTAADIVLNSEVDPGASLESSQTLSSPSTRESSPEPLSATALDGLDASTPTLATDHKFSQAERLGMHLDPASSSSLSVHEVASQREKPGVITPSRHDTQPPDPQTSPTKSKIKPMPPKARRWRGRRATGDEDSIPNITAEKITEESISPGHNSPSPLHPSTPLAATPHLLPETDRRNSTTTSGLVPPLPPTHARRSASNPPPAVPPPRRSVVHHLSSHSTPVTSPSRMPQQCPSHKSIPKPEPPKARRWGRGRHAQTDSEESRRSQTSISSVHSTASTQHREQSAGIPSTNDTAVISVEQAVQNVTLH